MSYDAYHANISQAWIELNRRFARTQEEWNDEVRAQFERDFWQSLHGDMPNYLQSLEDLGRIVQQAKQHVK